jgi:hypothetical protein
MAEQSDNDGWQMLIALCEELGEEEIAVGFRAALIEEDVHLESVRRWLTAYTSALARREKPERGGEEAVVT